VNVIEQVFYFIFLMALY